MILQCEFRRKHRIPKKAAWTTNNKGNSAKVINGVGNACDLDSILCCSNHPIRLCSIWITGSSALKFVGDRALRFSRALTQLLIGNEGHVWNAVISHEFRASFILQETIPLQQYRQKFPCSQQGKTGKGMGCLWLDSLVPFLLGRSSLALADSPPHMSTLSSIDGTKIASKKARSYPVV